jgi:hypothetical protein
LTGRNGGANALVNNAGIFVGKSWDEITDVMTGAILDVNGGLF